MSNVQVADEISFADYLVDPDDDEAPDDGIGPLKATSFLPHPDFGYIAFDVHVPTAAQSGVSYRPVNIGEDFEVQMFFGINFPVAYITCKDQDIHYASDAVMFLRDFLRGELERRKARVQLRILGPSPFWADFIAIPRTMQYPPEEGAASSKQPIDVVSIHHRVGYDDIFCEWDPHFFSGAEEALPAIFHLLQDELALFYKIVCDRNVRMRRAVEVSNEISELVKMHEASGVKVALRRYAFGGRLSRRVSLKVVQLQIVASRQRERAAQDIAELYSTGASGALKDYLDKELNASFEGEDPGTRELATLLESRRAADVNVAVLLASSLVGAGIGSAVGALLAK